jgi:hypothetical protein
MKATIKIKGFEFSLDYTCSRCRKLRPAYMFIGDGKVFKTCEKCRGKKP